MQTKHVTINIGPQDPLSWMFVAAAAIFIALFVFSDAPTPNDVEIARIKAQAAQAERAK